MEYKKYKSTKEALADILRDDQEYIVIKHKAKKGYSVKRHYHPKANEWLIIDNGKFTIKMDDETETFNLKNQVTVFKFMVSVKHMFSTDSDISYFVVRDVQDETVFSNNLF